MKIELKTLEEIRIYSDPYRIQILEEFHKFDRPATMKEVADAMHEVPAKVYYHAKKLEKIGLLKLVDTKLVNGITAKYYEPFKGHIYITKKELDEPVKQVFQSHTEKLLNTLYEKNKIRFLKAAQADTPSTQLTNTNVYLNKKQADELFQWIGDFCEQHKDANKSPDSESYEVFFTISKSEDSSTKK